MYIFAQIFNISVLATLCWFLFCVLAVALGGGFASFLFGTFLAVVFGANVCVALACIAKSLYS
jgi:hypothetical protein